MANTIIKSESSKNKKSMAATKGAACELLACAYLIDAGYMVFRNISPRGCIDIVAIRGNEIRKFDVKSASLSLWENVSNISITYEQKAMGVEILYVDEYGCCHTENDDNRSNLDERIVKECLNCHQKFFIGNARELQRKFCSIECRSELYYKLKKQF